MFQIGLPHMGAYGPIIARVFNRHLADYGVQIKLAPITTKKTVNLGSQYMDENICLPAKIVFGNFLQLLEQGIRTVLEWDNCGTCRQKAYGLVHQSVLRQLGKQATVVPIQPRELIKGLKRIAPQVPVKIWKTALREGFRAIWKYDQSLMERQAEITPGKPRIGVCGEIYTILEPAANAQLLKRIEEQGADIHVSLLLGQFLHFPLDEKFSLKRVIWLLSLSQLGMWSEIYQWARGKMRRPDVDYRLFRQAEQSAEHYIPEHNVGGHGKESVIWTIYYALAGFDGVVHILPFPCMPESTVSTLLDEISRDYRIPVNHLVFDQQFGEQNLMTRAEAMVNLLRFKKEGLSATLNIRRPGFWMGVDVGSTTCKAVIIDGETLQIVDQEYQFIHREPLASIRNVLCNLLSRNPSMNVRGITTTGSGRRLAQALLDAPLAIDEISCQVIGCMLVQPAVRSIIEIGGQDSKVIKLDETGLPTWFNMNSICSAGTGAFLSAAAREFRIPIEELGSCARKANCAVTITGRCGVFAEADIVSKQQAGQPKEGIVRGMCEALAKNFLGNVCRSQAVIQPAVFTGGVALNEGVVDAFKREIGDITTHPQSKISGALGAAFMAMAREAVGGLSAKEINEALFDSSVFNCGDCANQCEVSLIKRNGEIVAALGSRCGKHENLIGTNK